MVTPVGDSIGNAVATKASAGIDSYAAKLILGDWTYFNDTVNGQVRLISPQGFVAGLLSALSPEQSSLNKQLAGIVATQKSNANSVYSDADLQTLAQAGIDVVANPCPGGAYFGIRIGRNTSSNQVINGDNYPRLTNYIAYTLNTAMGLYIGRLQSTALRNQAMGTINAFLAAMQQQGMIGDVSNPTKQPFSVQLNAANNPAARVALGYMQVDVRITYLSIVTVLLINVEGGQSVSVTVAAASPNA
jgi:phage tail sheath protein FI